MIDKDKRLAASLIGYSAASRVLGVGALLAVLWVAIRWAVLLP